MGNLRQHEKGNSCSAKKKETDDIEKEEEGEANTNTEQAAEKPGQLYR